MEAGLKPESFFKPAHKVIFHVMLELYSKNSGVDEVTVLDALSSRSVGSVDWLKRQQKLTDPNTPLIQLVGGAAALIQLTNRIESTANSRYWLDIVHQKWLLRRLIETASHIADEAYINQDQLEVFIGEAEQRILSIQEDRSGDSARKFDVSIDDAGALIQNILAGKQDDGVLTIDVPDGLFDLDGS